MMRLPNRFKYQDGRLVPAFQARIISLDHPPRELGVVFLDDSQDVILFSLHDGHIFAFSTLLGTGKILSKNRR